MRFFGVINSYFEIISEADVTDNKVHQISYPMSPAFTPHHFDTLGITRNISMVSDTTSHASIVDVSLCDAQKVVIPALAVFLASVSLVDSDRDLKENRHTRTSDG